MKVDLWTLGRHPRFETLSAFSDGLLPKRNTKRVARHLERCLRCRREIGHLRDVDRMLAEVRTPPLPDDLFDRILEDRGDDLRVILPSAAPANGRPTVGAGSVTLVLLVGAATVGLLWTTRASADSSSLEIESTPTARGFALRYEPSSKLATGGAVRIRARAWSAPARPWLGAAGTPPRTVEAILRVDDDAYSGSLALPAGSVFALAAVEGLSGAGLDTNFGRFWTVFERGVDGEPTEAALAAELSALTELRAAGFVTTAELRDRARVFTERYPGSLHAWRERAFFDLSLPGMPETQSAARILHLEKLAELALEGGGPDTRSSDEIALLMGYARTLGDTASVRRLRGRMNEVEPGHPVLSEWRVADARGAFDGNPSRMLAEFETEWKLVDGANRVVAPLAFGVAMEARDARALETWARRWYAQAVDSRDGIALQLAEVPGLGDLAAELLRERLSILAASDRESVTRASVSAATAPTAAARDSVPAARVSVPAARDSASAARDTAAAVGSASALTRPLYLTVDAFRADRNQLRARLFAALGRLLVRAGDREEGMRFLEDALEVRWDAAAAGALTTEIEADDPSSVRAAELRARLAADPLVGVGSIGGETSGDVDARELRRARASLIGELLGDGRSGIVPSGLPEQLSEGRVALIAVWHTVPAIGSREVERLTESRPDLSRQEVRIAVVAPSRWSEEIRDVSERIGAVAVADESSIAENFGGWHFREYIVVSEGRYWAYYDIEAALRLALLLALQ